jgi:hypothetical protein
MNRNRSIAGAAGLFLAVLLAFACPAPGFFEHGLEGEDGWHELLSLGRAQRPSRGELPPPAFFRAPLSRPSGRLGERHRAVAAAAEVRLLIHRFNE